MYSNYDVYFGISSVKYFCVFVSDSTQQTMSVFIFFLSSQLCPSTFKIFRYRFLNPLIFKSLTPKTYHYVYNRCNTLCVKELDQFLLKPYSNFYYIIYEIQNYLLIK